MCSVGGSPSLQRENKTKNRQTLSYEDHLLWKETHLCARTYSKGEKAPRNDLQVEFFH